MKKNFFNFFKSNLTQFLYNTRERKILSGVVGGSLLIFLSFKAPLFLGGTFQEILKGLGEAFVGSLLSSGIFLTGRFLAHHYRLYARILKSISSLDKSFFVTDFEGQILFANKSIRKIFPFILEEGLDSIHNQLADQSSRRKFKNILQSCETLIQRTSSILYVKRGDKEVQPFRLTLYPLNEHRTLIWRLDRNVYKSDDRTFDGNRFLQSLNLEKIFNSAPAGNIFLDQEGRIQGMNQTFKDQFLKDQKIELGVHFKELLSENQQEATLKGLQKILDGKPSAIPIEVHFRWGMEAVAYARLFKYPIPGEANKSAEGLFLQIFDNKEQKQLQLRLLQSQRIQAMGQLAGGIAHDFNNLLTAMIGFCDLLLIRHSPADESFTDVMQIKQNANRAANLVRQLLAFSRQQALQPKMIDISEVLADLSILLQRLIGVSIDLKIIHGHDLGWVKVDRGQIEQVIINLVVNARDAVGENGKIQIKTSHVTFDQPVHLRDDVIEQGQYLLLEVVDNGKGIEKQNLDKIFDPFFSTKEVGSGTGLGLSTVYGIVRQTEGYIDVKSKVGEGTTFKIYLPRYEGILEAVNNSKASQENRDLTGSGTILLVEDEGAVRLFSARALRDKGYEVIEAKTGIEALEYLGKTKEGKESPVDLIITDVVMPQMDGPTFINQAQDMDPNLKVIFISGYAEDAFRMRLNQDQNICFLPKPFSLKNLAEKVKEVLKDQDEEKRRRAANS